MAVSITICNLALGDVRAPAIADIAEGSPEAQACARYYPNALQQLLDFYDWSFATRTASLAQLATNERNVEWGYAYALPNDCLKPIRLLPPGINSAVTSDIATRFRYWPYPVDPNRERWDDFTIEAGKLYAHLTPVTLEYATDDISEAAMSPAFREAVRKRLASELAIVIRDSREMKGDLLKEAEVALERAIAVDKNRQPNREALDDVALARRGY